VTIRLVTGTDTGVGKTVAAAALAHRARGAGLRVRYVKPVQTGVRPGAPGDADFVRAAADVDARELLRLPEPLAPAVAAERAGRPIDGAALAAEARRLAEGIDLLLVEGAGGLLVPLDARWTVADLAASLGAELVVVVRPGLGTLNHTALTLEAARARGLPVAGLVVSGWPPRPGVVERTNLERLEAMAPILAVLRRVRGVSVDAGRAEAWRRALDRGTVFLAHRSESPGTP
jgi:dethiobiotin synthetase